MSVSVPKKGAEILRWAQEITRAHNRAVPIAGAGLRQRQTDAGTTLSLARAESGALAVPFAVSVDDGNIVVRIGRHYWYDTTNEDYTVTTLDSTAGAWASVAVPTAGNSKYVYFTRAHDAGAVTTATVTKGIATAEATVTALANDYTRVWIVAVLTADADGVVTIEQRLTEDVEDGPDCRTKGTIVLWNSTTLPRGWAWYTGLQEKFPVGYKSGSSDYGTIGATGGNAAHGAGVNDHLPHLVNHTHSLTTDTANVIDYPDICIGTGGVVQISFVTGFQNPLKCDDMLSDWCDDEQSPPEEKKVTAGDGDRNIAEHTTSDNRPPWCSVGFIVKL